MSQYPWQWLAVVEPSLNTILFIGILLFATFTLQLVTIDCPKSSHNNQSSANASVPDLADDCVGIASNSQESICSVNCSIDTK